MAFARVSDGGDKAPFGPWLVSNSRVAAGVECTTRAAGDRDADGTQR